MGKLEKLQMQSLKLDIATKNQALKEHVQKQKTKLPLTDQQKYKLHLKDQLNYPNPYKK